MSRPHPKQPGQEPGQQGLKVVENQVSKGDAASGSAPPAPEAEAPDTAERRARAARQRMHPPRVWPD